MLKNNKQTNKNKNKTHKNKTNNNNNKNPFLQIGCKNGFKASQLDVFCS